MAGVKRVLLLTFDEPRGADGAGFPGRLHGVPGRVAVVVGGGHVGRGQVQGVGGGVKVGLAGEARARGGGSVHWGGGGGEGKVEGVGHTI